MKEPSARLMEAIAGVSEVTGHRFTELAVRILGAELARYPEEQVLRAILRCVREVKGHLTLADILERIDDGRPSPDEAWAQVSTTDESLSISTTTEAMAARAACASLIPKDIVAARMAFLAAYKKLILENRARGVPVNQFLSLGTDKSDRVRAVSEAVQAGRVSAEYAMGLLGPTEGRLPNKVAELIAGTAKTLPDDTVSHIEQLRKAVGME